MSPKRSETTYPPRHLGAVGRALYRLLRDEYGIADAGGLLLLTTVGECADRMAAARAAIAEHGEVVMDRYHQPKVNPACQLEKDARGQMLQAVKLLGLDVDPDTAVRGGRR